VAKVEHLLEQEDRMAQAYAGSFAASLGRARETSASVRASLLQELDELRDEIVDRFDSVLPGGPREKVRKERVDDLERELDRSLDTFERIVGQELDSGVRRLSVAGGSITSEALMAAGVQVTEPFTESIADVFRKAGEAVTKLVERVKKRVMSGINSAVAGALDTISFLSFIRSLLETTQQERRGRMRHTGPAFLLDQMAETTMLQAFSQSQQDAAERLARQVPDLRKTWVTAEDGRVRQGHAEAAERYAVGGEVGPIPVGDAYEVLDYSNVGRSEFATVQKNPRRVLNVPPFTRGGSVGSAELMFPRDPDAPISFIINCRCVSMEVVGSFQAAIDQAAGIVREEL
jgi:hypothetical protein